MALGLSGVLAIIVGLVIMLWPEKSAILVAAIIATYAIASGVVYTGLAIFSRGKQGWARLGNVLLGVIFIIAGIVAFVNLLRSPSLAAYFVGVLIAVLWIVQGATALSTLGDSSSKIWTILYAALNLLAGIAALISPLWATAVLWVILGISLLVLGLVQVIRALTFGRHQRAA